MQSGILIRPGVWRRRTWAENGGLGGCAPFLGGRGPHLSQCGAGAESYCVPSFILIRPTVWPQYTNVAERERETDRQDRTTVR